MHRSPSPKLLSGTNYCDVGFERDPHSRRVVVTAAAQGVEQLARARQSALRDARRDSGPHGLALRQTEAGKG